MADLVENTFYLQVNEDELQAAMDLIDDEVIDAVATRQGTSNTYEISYMSKWEPYDLDIDAIRAVAPSAK